MKLLCTLLTLAIFFISCSNPLDKKYSEATVAEDLKEIWEHDKPDSAAVKSIVGYMMLSAFTKEDLNGKKYSEIVSLHQAAVKKMEANQQEQNLLAAKVAQDENDRRERLSSVVTVAMYDKDFSKEDYQEYITYGVAFNNKSDKDIRAIKGMLIINDLFDEKIKAINLTYDTPIKSNTTEKSTFTTEYNQFMDEDKRLLGKDIRDLKVVWSPEKIIFMDGTTLD